MGSPDGHVSANVCNNPKMPLSKVKADAASAAGLGRVLGLQEIDTTYVSTVQAGLGSAFTLWPTNKAVPIAVHSDYTIKKKKCVKMHGGKKKVSPSRYYTLMHLLTPAGGKISVINTHFVSKAWSDPNASSKQWRIKMWNKAYAKVQKKVIAQNQKGLNVLITGDFNRKDLPAFTPDQRNLSVNGYDYVLLCPVQAKPNFHRDAGGTKPANSDHKQVYAQGSWAGT